jgi:8-oxo-dGTP diphosphatase
MTELPKVQRVAAYAVVVRGEEILLSRLAERVSPTELWTLPGGGVDHGEHPGDAVVREVWEETGLHLNIEPNARIYSGHLPGVWRDGRRVDAHAVRIVYSGWVPIDSPDPRVVEVDGSTVEAAWVSIADVLRDHIPVVPMVREALSDLRPTQIQRLAAYALIRRDDDILLTRLAVHAPYAGQWTLPGGGVDHGESPRDTVRREVAEECGVDCVVGDLIGVHDVHFVGTRPDGRVEDFHGLHVVYAATVAEDAEPVLLDLDGTTDAVAWVPLAELGTGDRAVIDLVTFALAQDVPSSGTH